jgi:PAS domain S-box-containing protein
VSFSLPQIFTFSLLYLSLLFGSAYATEQGWLPRRITHNRFIRVVSLGVFAGALSFYGTLGFAANFGASYLLYYFGASAVFLLAPLLLNPIARVALAHKLGSLADVFAFRYRRPWVGGIVSLFMLTGAIPLLALQIQAVADTVHFINQDISRDGLAMIFCSTMAVFAILFGARHVSTRDKHEGLIVALGLESMLKLIAFMVIAIYAVYSVFGSVAHLNEWLMSNQPLQAHIERELSEGSSRMMLLTFFAGAVAMPHMFHILLTENDDAGVIRSARWGFPLYMLLLSLCVAPIYWAAEYSELSAPAEFFAIALGIEGNSESITLLAFIGGFAACSGVLIVLTLALATMSVNHLVLPLYRVSEEMDFFSFLLNTRRTLIIGIIVLAYGLYNLFSEQQNLMSLGLVSFIAVLQFLPGLIGAFYWRDANSYGLLAGLLVGFLFWGAMLFLPLLIDIVYSNLFGTQHQFAPGPDIWFVASITSLLANTFAYIIFSRLNLASQDERVAAAECISDSPILPYQGELGVSSVSEIRHQLVQAIGEAAAFAQVHLGLEDLQLSESERRPFALIQLRNQIESNLTSIVGQTIAYSIFAQYLPFRETKPGQVVIESLQSREYRFESHQSYLTGLSAELDNLRRYHRQLLQDLPTAVCSLDGSGRILTWNRAMAELTGIEAESALDYPFQMLPTYWMDLLNQFIQSTDSNSLKSEVRTEEQVLTLNLHKELTDTGDILIVIENITEEKNYERQLMHNHRLAAIGQLAAGVAHEVGNPITGIACLAQNIPIETDNPELLEISQQILEQTDRISAILNSLINFAHRGKESSFTQKSPVRLKQCVDEAIYLLSLPHDSKEIRFTNSIGDDFYTQGDGQRLLQVFVNVLSNAQDASPQNSEVTIDAEQISERLMIQVTDQGQGISDDKRNAIFEPFYTTKDPGQGTGLGLAIVTTIIQEHEGKISAQPHEPIGTRVIIDLPNLPRPDLDKPPQQLTSEPHS